MPAGVISAALAIVLTLGLFQNRGASDNVSDLEELVDGSDQVDLGALGFTRLLGRGRVTAALKVIVDSASPSAVAKIEGAGGSVIGMGDSEEEG